MPLEHSGYIGWIASPPKFSSGLPAGAIPSLSRALPSWTWTDSGSKKYRLPFLLERMDIQSCDSATWSNGLFLCWLWLGISGSTGINTSFTLSEQYCKKGIMNQHFYQKIKDPFPRPERHRWRDLHNWNHKQPGRTPRAVPWLQHGVLTWSGWVRVDAAEFFFPTPNWKNNVHLWGTVQSVHILEARRG